MTSNKELMASARESLSNKWVLATVAVSIVNIIIVFTQYTVPFLELFGFHLSNEVSLGDFLQLSNDANVSIEYANQMIDVPTPLGYAISIFTTFSITGILTIGSLFFALALSRGFDAKISYLFVPFKRFLRYFMAVMAVLFFTFLWALLLIIPGIIAAYAYSQTFFILIEESDIGILEAMKKSRNMMIGNKWKLALLGFRFIGWSLLAYIPLIGFFIISTMVFGIDGLNTNLSQIIMSMIQIIGSIPLYIVSAYMLISFAKFYDDIKEQSEVSVEEVDNTDD